MPGKRKKTMIARGFSSGGTPSKASMAWDSLKDSVTSLPRRTVSVVKDALTVKPTVEAIEGYKGRQKDALKDIDDATDVQQKRKGGIVKSKPRGVGVATKGHGKGKFR
jgi:hypothetical protein